MAVRSPLTTAQLLKRLTPLLAAPAALLLNPGRAEAVLTYNIFQSGFDVVLQASGSINQVPPTCCSTSVNPAGVFTTFSNLVTGSTSNSFPIYSISGPATIPASPLGIFFADSFSGVNTVLQAIPGFGFFGISDYVLGTDINSSATFNNTTLAALGFTTPGLIGTWTIVEQNTPNTFDTIRLEVGPPAEVHVPGPLPLLGAAAAFGWSRRLRRRIATACRPSVRPPAGGGVRRGG
jgi:hypothetical protein